MDGIYDVTLGGEPVGKVFVDRQGLYYRFRCRCCLTGNVMYRILACCGEKQQDLGILVPMEGDFGLQKRLATKLFPKETPRFLAVPRHPEIREKISSVYPEEPYSYIKRMKNEYLLSRK